MINFEDEILSISLELQIFLDFWFVLAKFCYWKSSNLWSGNKNIKKRVRQTSSIQGFTLQFLSSCLYFENFEILALPIEICVTSDRLITFSKL